MHIQAFKTSDGWLVVCAGNHRQFHALCEKIGLPDLATDERYSSNQKRLENRKELISTMSERYVQIILSSKTIMCILIYRHYNTRCVRSSCKNCSTMYVRFAQHSTSHWLDVLEGGGFPYGPVNNMAEAFSDPQVAFTP